MGNMRWVFGAAAAALALTGCFTIRETDPVQVTMARVAEGKTLAVGVGGFAATLTEYVPVYGYETVYVDGYYGPGRRGRGRVWHGGHYATATTETLLPQTRVTDAFLSRAQAMLEDYGFLVRTRTPAYTVEVTFEGPFKTEGETAREWAWMLCSVLSAEYSVQTWTAKLRVHETATGRVAHTRDFTQKYENTVWSPLFFVGLSGYSRNTFNYMQTWCLTALTDQAVAEAAAFLAPRAK